MLNDRKKLIELIENAPVWKNASFHEACTQVADHLIANGVIALPCKIGDTVYEVRTCKKDGYKFIVESKCAGIHMRDNRGFRDMRKKDYMVVRNSYCSARHIDLDGIGETVFFTREDAEAARKDGNSE